MPVTVQVDYPQTVHEMSVKVKLARPVHCIKFIFCTARLLQDAGDGCRALLMKLYAFPSGAVLPILLQSVFLVPPAAGCHCLKVSTDLRFDSCGIVTIEVAAASAANATRSHLTICNEKKNTKRLTP